MLSAVSISSCSKDDEESINSTDLIGSWEEVRDDDSTFELFHLTFKSDGTEVFTITYEGYDSSKYPTQSYSYKWHVSGNKLYETSTDNKTNVYTIKVANNKLYISSDGETIIYKKVK